MTKLSASLDFSSDNIAIVGGSSGIGAAIAAAFHAAGATVYITGTKASFNDYDNRAELAKFHYTQVDVSQRSGIAAWVSSLPQVMRSLILCQGTVKYQKAEFALDVFDQVLDINLSSMMACLTMCKDKLKAHPSSSAITVSSIMAFKGSRGNPGYSASKWGIRGLTQTMADAYASEGIRINGIAPGFVETKMTANTVENPKRLASTINLIPAGRIGEPTDMAGTALFLASELSNYIYGQTIVVDGGMLLR